MINIALSFLFPALWIFYFVRKDKDPEPLSWLFLASLLGFLAAFLSYFLEDYLYRFFADNKILFNLFSVFIEEFFKFFLFLLFIAPYKVFDEPIDAMIYMMIVAYGFAAIENFFYFRTTGAVYILIGRFLTANFLHILSSSLIGYGYGCFRFYRKYLIFIISFLGGAFLHFIYNFVIIFYMGGIFMALPIIWSAFLIVLSELDYLTFINERRTREGKS